MQCQPVKLRHSNASSVMSTFACIVVGDLLLYSVCITYLAKLPVLYELVSSCCSLALHWCSLEETLRVNYLSAVGSKRNVYASLLLCCILW
jgi:hypothetical protein